MKSRMFVYYNERAMENTVDTDAGASLSDGISVLHTQGVCNETVWPYDVSKFSDKPTTEAFDDAKNCEEANYNSTSATQDLNPADTASVELDLNVIKTILSANCPIVCGIQVYSELESQDVADSGILPMPSDSSNSLGGHAIAFAGYDDSKNSFLMRNSWGTSWGTSGASGVRGYFWLPYDYMMQYGSDLWKVGSITVLSNPVDPIDSSDSD